MLKIVFLSSSIEKLAHIRHICREYDMDVVPQPHYGKAYEEPRITNREKLLEESIRDASERLRRTTSTNLDKFFFLEDTSVVIHSLSRQTEFPGLDVKYWMNTTTFESLDAALREAGNDRSVTVRSDIVLALPRDFARLKRVEYLTFSSSTKGHVIAKSMRLKTQAYYPWLSSKTFNKWFVPNGCSRPLSSLPIIQADNHDFRRGAIQDMLKFLERHGVVKRRAKTVHLPIQESISEMKSRRCVFVIVGPPCAGKTTLAIHLTKRFGYRHIEASDFMWLCYRENHGVDSDISIGDFAERALRDDPLIIVNRIAEHIKPLKDAPLAITGFRMLKEIQGFSFGYQGILDIEYVFVNAHKPKRFSRCRGRQYRIDRPTCKREFDELEEQQYRMGLKEIENHLKNKQLMNNETVREFFKSFNGLHGDRLTNIGILPARLIGTNRKWIKLEDMILLALLRKIRSGEYFTTTQIANTISLFESSVYSAKNKNNVSRYFNQRFYPFYELISLNGKRRYRLSQTGLNRALVVRRANWTVWKEYRGTE